MNVSSFQERDYDDNSAFRLRENKANQSQSGLLPPLP
jgi:hypothetical protein